ncbi:urease accessory protein UreF [Paenibacillus selenitireducens]|uniref:Urease accessory protein UreF n=1 Tax=Paenibacillus selenitireducens TaxID=1324314 RepID=A0A1T2X4A9_9BACL|nr:urease accessory protein UreF [Paenibacillus selenitireducens]OPA74741.1 urease accessory protein UreF [Paenibacillus selenitireducens]
MDSYLLSLLQLCDSNLPTGAFSHSFGLETYIQNEQVVSKQTFAKWLQVYVREQLVYNDGLALRLAYEALVQDQWETLWNLDRMITVQSMARETREGSARMGQRMMQLGMELYLIPALVGYQDRVQAKQSSGHPAIVFAIIAHHLAVPKSTAILSYLYSCTASLIQNGVRGIPLGQTDGQRLFQELQSYLLQAVEKIEGLDEDDFGITSPGIEISQMKHERLHIRLFMS